MTWDALLSAQGLKVHFKSEAGWVKAVDGVSFEIRPGEILGLVGESGSGKTVLCHSVLKLNPPSPACFLEGKVIFDGKDLTGRSQGELRKIRGNTISMVFQDPMASLNPYLTVGRQLTEVLETHQNISRSEAKSRSIEMLERVGISEAAQRIDQYPHQFSGGMCQRVLIAMALLCRPKLLIADEPTSALDVTVQSQILRLIEDLRKDFGTSVLLVTHDLGVAAQIADRMIVMYAGRFVEEGQPDVLLRSPKHPYTRGLLESLPSLTGERVERLAAIKGLPPDLSRTPPGCAFHPRCAMAVEHCRQDRPELISFAPGHSAACPEMQK